MSLNTGDIASRADVERMVDEFYARVRLDPMLGPIFDDIAQTDWDEHLPRMYDFWSSVLFGASSFRGNPLAVHLALNRRTRLGASEFQRWLQLFFETIDTAFSGPGAEDTKSRAARIAAALRQHIDFDVRAQDPA